MSYTVRQNPASTSNYTVGRQGRKINKIILHHAATTDFDGIGRTFQNPSRQTSAHYGVGRHNNVDQYVSEANTAWHSGNWDANVTSIGIENVNSSGAPNWDVANETIDTLVNLVRDIAKRNGLFPVRVGVNLFQHKDFFATYCAGRVGDRLQEIADRVNGGSTPEPTPDQILEVGSTIKFDGTFRADDLQFIGGIWQVRTNRLCPVDFTWADNGIPVDPLVEVAGGYKTPDQVLQVGSEYVIPGKYTVLDLGAYKGRWLALINFGIYKFWVDVEPVTEIKRTDAGTPTPSLKPVETPKPVEPPRVEPRPVEPPVEPEKPKDEPEPTTEPETPVIAPEQPKVPIIDAEELEVIKKEQKMAFTEEHQKQLAVNQENVLNANEFKPVISDKVKTVAYFATDISAILSTLVLTLLAISGILDAIVAITVSAAITTALLGLKQTFRLSAKK